MTPPSATSPSIKFPQNQTYTANKQSEKIGSSRHLNINYKSNVPVIAKKLSRSNLILNRGKTMKEENEKMRPDDDLKLLEMAKNNSTFTTPRSSPSPMLQ